MNNHINQHEDGEPNRRGTPQAVFGDDLLEEIVDLLNGFQGEDSLKILFWSLLSYNRQRLPLPASAYLPFLSPPLLALEIFCSTDALTILYAETDCTRDLVAMERISWAVKSRFPKSIVILHAVSQDTWTLIYADEIRRPRVRLLPIPGPEDQLRQTAKAIAALSAADASSAEERNTLQMQDGLDTYFPGVMPQTSVNFGDLTEFVEHVRPKLRGLEPYLRDITSYPLLTERQERGMDISNEMPAPDGSLLPYNQWRLIVHNLRMVVWIAYRVPQHGMEISDLIQEGTRGLIMASERFDPNLGNRFSTYACYWIRQTMFRALHTNWSLIRWPIHSVGKLIRAELEGKDDGLPPRGRIVASLGEFDNSRVYCTCSLAEIDEEYDREKVAGLIRAAIDTLTPRESAVLKWRFGVDCDHEYTLEEIAMQLGCTRERIRQIEMKALARMKYRIPPWIAKEYASSHSALRAQIHSPVAA